MSIVFIGAVITPLFTKLAEIDPFSVLLGLSAAFMFVIVALWIEGRI